MFGPRSGGTPTRQRGRERLGAGIVESHAVYERALRDQTEHARGGIAGLWMPRDAAEFAEAKPEGFPDRDSGSGFVHASRQSERIRKAQSEEVDGQVRGSEHLLS